MSTQHIFNGTHQQIVSGTSALDELTIPLWPLSPDRQLHMMGDARTLTVGTVLISNTYEMDLQTFIPLYPDPA